MDNLLINANRNLDRYAGYGCTVIADREPGFPGPLAGFDSAMQAARTEWILTVPCDGPNLSPDLMERLTLALHDQDAELAVATDGARIQPVHALLPVSLAASLRAFMGTGERKGMRAIESQWRTSTTGRTASSTSITRAILQGQGD